MLAGKNNTYIFTKQIKRTINNTVHYHLTSNKSDGDHLCIAITCDGNAQVMAMHSDTETQRHRDTETQRHKDTETQRRCVVFVFLQLVGRVENSLIKPQTSSSVPAQVCTWLSLAVTFVPAQPSLRLTVFFRPCPHRAGKWQLASERHSGVAYCAVYLQCTPLGEGWRL